MSKSKYPSRTRLSIIISNHITRSNQTRGSMSTASNKAGNTEASNLFSKTNPPTIPSSTSSQQAMIGQFLDGALQAAIQALTVSVNLSVQEELQQASQQNPQQSQQLYAMMQGLQTSGNSPIILTRSTCTGTQMQGQAICTTSLQSGVRSLTSPLLHTLP